jgi:hypothetical protein
MIVEFEMRALKYILFARAIKIDFEKRFFWKSGSLFVRNGPYLTNKVGKK